MTRRLLVGGWVAVCALALVTGGAFAQEKKGDEKKTPPKAGEVTDKAKDAAKDAKAGGPSHEEMMAVMQEAAKLAKEHETLKALAGSWKTQTKCWMDPSAPPEVSSGTYNAELILGGRWLVGNHVGTMGDQPFEGHGMWGYDTQKKKYVNIWADNWGTAAMISEGTADPTGKILTFKGTYDCPMEKRPVTCRMVTTIKSPNEFVFEMYQTGVDGKETKGLEVTYTK